jgi:hypothetical protein
MAWFTDRHCFLLAVTFYGWSTLYSVFLWRKGFRRDGWINYLLLTGGLTLHTLAMLQRGLTLHACPVNNLYEATTFLLWALGLACLICALLPRLKSLCAFAAPVLFTVGVFALMPSLDPHGPVTGIFRRAAQPARRDHPARVRRVRPRGGGGGHVPPQQHDLKFNRLRALLSLLPPMQRLEHITTGLVFAGFLLLTLGLAAGPNNCRTRKACRTFPIPKSSGPRCSGWSIWNCCWPINFSAVPPAALPSASSSRSCSCC